MSQALRGRGTGETTWQQLTNGGLLPGERGAARFIGAAQHKGTGGLGEGVGAVGRAPVGKGPLWPWQGLLVKGRWVTAGEPPLSGVMAHVMLGTS